MIILDLMREFTTNPVWAELNKLEFTAKDGHNWYCQRFEEKQFEIIEHLLKYVPKSIVIKADGQKLLVLQTELADRGVRCNTPISPENYHFNVMVIYHAVEESTV